jgi:hypothetical protein
MNRIAYLSFMLVGMAAVITVVVLLMIFFEMDWLSNHVYPLAGMRLPEWLESFKQWATLSIVGAGVVSVIWYVLGAFVFNFNDSRKNYRRVWWGLLFVAVVPLALAGYVFTTETNEGAGWAYFFYFVNSLLIYFLGTVLFSPPSVMYTPIGAKYVRWW